MKDLLRDFTFKKILKHLSSECIDTLLISKAGFDSEKIVSIRKTKKTKTAILEAIAAEIHDNNECIRILRVAYFFHKNRSAFIGLRNYFTSKNISVDWESVSNGKSEAEQTVLLYMEHGGTLAEYFILCLHTHHSRTYCSCRNDYVDADKNTSPTEEVLNQLGEKLLTGMKGERGSRYCGKQTFEHDGKTFLLLEFDNLPTHQREYEDGKDKAEDKYRRLALDLVYVFDLNNKTIETIAETAELRFLMHRVCASEVYGKQEIVARPPKNEIFDLEKLLQYTLDGKPLAVVNTKSTVTKAYLDAMRINRSQFPYWEASVSLKIPANHSELQRDWVVDAQKMVTSLINTQEEPNGWWHKSYVQANHADILMAYWDDIEMKEASKKITVNSSGGTNLDHSAEDENFKIFLRELGLLRTPADGSSGNPIELMDSDEELA